jgi:O-6-methylguanine DNA methyltransferase
MRKRQAVKSKHQPLDISCGTPFQQKVWRAIMKIPRGQTRSYAWVAKMAGRPRAIRAAANACGANPYPVIIPCHRVIRSDGTIGGFSGPLKLKKRLLKNEGAKL